MKRLLLLGFCSTVLALEGCSSFRVVHEQTYNQTNLNTFQTFNFVPTDNLSKLNSVQPETIDQIKSSVVEEMTRRGYRQSDRPDLLINVGLSVQEKVQTRETTIREAPIYMAGQRNYSWRSQEVEAGRYNEGTLTVEVVDARRNALAWEGTVTGAVGNQRTSPRKIDKAVAELFTKFPGTVR